MLPKALWLKRNEPEIYERAERIVECTDWMMHRLTGEWTLSLNHVAVKWNYARPDGGWPLGLLRAVGLDDLPGKWPERIVPLGRGEATSDAEAAAETWACEPGRPVAQGGIDAYLGMLGLGATGDGDVAVIVGSSTCHLAQSRDGVFGSGAAGCYPDATVEGLYTLEAGQTATGSILDWYRRHFAGARAGRGRAAGRAASIEVLDEQAAAVPAGCRGAGRPRRLAGEPLALQEPAGPRGDRRACRWRTAPATSSAPSTRRRPAARGTSSKTPRAHGLEVERIFVGGGGAKSPLWLQIHADILKKPDPPDPRERGRAPSGSAMAAAVAAGIYPDFDEAARAMVAIERVVEPNPANRAIYDDLFARYVDLYQALNRP